MFWYLHIAICSIAIFFAIQNEAYIGALALAGVIVYCFYRIQKERE